MDWGPAQLNALALGLEIEWPEPLYGLLSTQSTVAGAGASFVSLSCALRGGGVSVLFSKVAHARLCCNYALSAVSRNCSSFSPLATSTHVQTLFFALLPVVAGVVPLVLLLPLHLKHLRSGSMTPAEARSWLTSTHITSVAVVLFLIHAPIAGQAFLLFSCMDLGGGMAYLIGDMGQRCYDRVHLSWAFGLGVPMIGEAAAFPLPVQLRVWSSCVRGCSVDTPLATLRFLAQ